MTFLARLFRRRSAPAPRKPYTKPRLVRDICPVALIIAAGDGAMMRRLRDLQGLGHPLAWPCVCSTHQLAATLGPGKRGVTLPAPARVH